MPTAVNDLKGMTAAIAQVLKAKHITNNVRSASDRRHRVNAACRRAPRVAGVGSDAVLLGLRAAGDRLLRRLAVSLGGSGRSAAELMAVKKLAAPWR